MSWVTVAGLDVECPTCGAAIDAACRRSSEHPLTMGDGDAHFHAERRATVRAEAIAVSTIATSHGATPETTPGAKPSAPRATRERLGDERRSVTRVFRLKYLHKDGSPDTMHFYFTAGSYVDGRLGEVFVKADKTGTLASGLMDAVGVLASLLLQYGVPPEVIVAKLRHTRFPPNQFTGDPEFPSCSSSLDLLAQWLTKKFIDGQKID